MILKIKKDVLNIKVKNIPVNMMFLLMWLVDAFYVQMSSSHYSDYIEYYDVYNGLKENYFEFGYYYLGLMAKSLGCDFFLFRMIIVTLTLLLLHNSILKYSKEPGWVTLIYMIHPFLLQCIQIRNAFAVAIIIFSLRFLDRENKNILKFIVLMVCAVSIHISSLLYLIILCCVFFEYKFIVKISISILLTLEIILYFLKNQIVYFMASLLKTQKITYYLSSGDNRFLSTSMLVYLVIYVVCYLVYNQIYKKKNSNDFDGVLLMSSLLIMAYIPLMLVNFDYFRIFEYFFPVVTMALFNVLHKINFSNFIFKCAIRIGFLSISLYQCFVWIIDNNNEVLNNIILWK